MIKLLCAFDSMLLSCTLKRIRDIIKYSQMHRTDKCVRDMVITYSQMHRTDKCSVIWPVWLNGLLFVYELSGCESHSRIALGFKIRFWLGIIHLVRTQNFPKNLTFLTSWYAHERFPKI